jgi:hypothetical protein
MKEMRISPRTQLLLAVAVLGSVALAVSAQLPELRRYMKVRSM